MKNILILFGLFAFISCSTKNDPGDVIKSEFERITTVITKDSWKVSSFEIDGEDVTNQFNEFEFIFAVDGLLSIETDDFSETGNWHYKGLPFQGELLYIDLSTSGFLSEISEQWHIESLINTQVELFISDSTSNTDKHLTFERI